MSRFVINKRIVLQHFTLKLFKWQKTLCCGSILSLVRNVNYNFPLFENCHYYLYHIQKQRKGRFSPKVDWTTAQRIWYMCIFGLKTFMVTRSVAHTDYMLHTWISSCKSILIATSLIKFHIGSCMNTWIISNHWACYSAWFFLINKNAIYHSTAS